MCWNENCLDFCIIRILVGASTELQCDDCDEFVDENTFCQDKRCNSYGERDDDYFDEDDMMEELLITLKTTKKEDEEQIIDEKCKTLISEYNRCHSSIKNDYLEALKFKVEILRSYFERCKNMGCEPNKWRAGGVRRRKSLRLKKKIVVKMKMKMLINTYKNFIDKCQFHF